jgi:hypothetical protein
VAHQAPEIVFEQIIGPVEEHLATKRTLIANPQYLLEGTNRKLSLDMHFLEHKNIIYDVNQNGHTRCGHTNVFSVQF